MRYYLNAGFGEPLSDSDLSLILDLGYNGVRQDVPSVEKAGELVKNLRFVKGIYVIPVADENTCQQIAHAVCMEAASLGEASNTAVEVGNEEDLKGKRWSKDPAGWTALVKDVATIAASYSPDIQVVSGGVSSVSREAMDWLTRSKVRELNENVVIGYHQYRSTPPQQPLKGYASRDEEFEALVEASGARTVWCTECGWHTAQRSEGWLCRRKWAYTDEQVALFLQQEIALNVGKAECFTVYQLNDGPNPSNDQDCFGIRRIDGTLKPSAGILI